jgi:hypothetical protein
MSPAGTGGTELLCIKPPQHTGNICISYFRPPATVRCIIFAASRVDDLCWLLETWPTKPQVSRCSSSLVAGVGAVAQPQRVDQLLRILGGDLRVQHLRLEQLSGCPEGLKRDRPVQVAPLAVERVIVRLILQSMTVRTKMLTGPSSSYSTISGKVW